MSSTIYLVRHGKDEDGYRGGWSQRGLVEEGRSQSKLLADYLYKNKDTFIFSRIISSDLNRAKETALYIGEQFQTDIEYSKEWRETNNGLIAGLPNNEVEKRYPGLYFRALDINEPYPGGESPKEFYNRIKKTFERLTKEAIKNDENIVLVTHGGVINVVLHLIHGIKWSNKNTPYQCQHTSVYKIELINNNWVVSLKNNVKHL